MSRILKRAIRRQKAIRESRDIAWLLFAVMLAIVYVGVEGVLRSNEVAGTVFTAGGIVSVLIGLMAIWVAQHLLREALRLGSLMKDSDRIMNEEDTSDLPTGVRWSRLNPFHAWKR
jgi:hypothetical protein